MDIDSKLSIVSWNLNSLDAKRSPMTRADTMSIESWFDLVEPSIVAFQETYWTESSKKLKLSVAYQHIPAISTVHGARSLSVYLHPSIAKVKHGVIGNEELFCQWVETRIPSVGSLIIINIYLPHKESLGKTNAPIKKLYSSLIPQVNLWKKDGKRVLIVGDFNTHNPMMGGSDRDTSNNRFRVRCENDFIDQNNLFFKVLPYPTRRRKGVRPGFLDHVIYTDNDIVESIEVGYTLNHKISDDQYPDHNPVFVHLSTPRSDFLPNDNTTWPWHKLTDEEWELIEAELCLSDLMCRISTMKSPENIMNEFHELFLEIRRKYLKPQHRKPGSKDFFDAELRDLKEQVKSLRRRVSRLRARGRASRANYLSETERDFKRVRAKYGKCYDRKKDAFLKSLEAKAVNSLDPKHLMTSLKRIVGERYNEIPVIIYGDS